MISLDKKKITGEQLRAARAMVRMTAQELADAAQVGVATVRRSEAENGQISATFANSRAMQNALEAAGIEFIFSDEAGIGVNYVRS